VTIRQWTVKGPGNAHLRVFEDARSAWVVAGQEAQASAPAVVTFPGRDDDPDATGEVFYVFRASHFIEISSRHTLLGTTRQVVEP